MSTEVIVQDEAQFNDAIADVKSDQTETTWALFGHVDNNPNEIGYMGSGSGSPEELAEHVDETQYHYGLVRLEETIDEMSTTVKFVYLLWMGKNVPFTKRGKFGVVQGSIEKLFSPYHISLEIDNQDDLTNEYFMSKIQETSGTKSKVLEVSEGKSRPERGFTSGTTTKMDTFVGSTPTKSAALTNIGKQGSSFGGFTSQAKTSLGVNIDDAVVDAIEKVHSDGSDINWLAAGYENDDPKKKLVLLESGDGTVEDIKTYCKDTNAVYGLTRTTDVVDDIPTVKFAFIQWVGEGLKPMAKAKIATFKGALEEVFKPMHVTIYATSLSEITSRTVQDKITAASGSKINIK